jgi:small-conductance mechanosensitive channel
MDENQIKEKVNVVQTAINELGTALTDNALFARLADANGPLQQEADEQATKAATLRDSHQKLGPVVAAKTRILSREIDRDLVEGRNEEVEAKRREIEQLKANLDGIAAEADACEVRALELARQQKQNARRLFEETYPQIRESTAAVVIATVQLLDKVWGDLQRYGAENGPAPGLPGQPLVKLHHWEDLTPRESGPEKPWFFKMREWFGGRKA